jgi:hypothetical protein
MVCPSLDSFPGSTWALEQLENEVKRALGMALPIPGESTGGGSDALLCPILTQLGWMVLWPERCAWASVK